MSINYSKYFKISISFGFSKNIKLLFVVNFVKVIDNSSVVNSYKNYWENIHLIIIYFVLNLHMKT